METWFIYTWDISNESGLIGPYQSKEEATSRAREMLEEEEAENAAILSIPCEVIKV